MFNNLHRQEKMRHYRQNLEDEEDIYEAEKALKEVEEKGSISFEEMKKRVGFKKKHSK